MESIRALSKIGELVKAEISSECCQKLDEGFYRKAYLELFSMHRSIPDSEPSRSIVIEVIEEAQRALRLFFKIRVAKGLAGAILGVEDKNLLEAERKAVKEIYEAMCQYAAAAIPQIRSRKAGERTLVVFEKDSIEVIGPEMKVYGPFKKGDLAHIPAELAAVLKSERVCREEKVNVE